MKKAIHDMRIAFAWGWTGGHVFPIQSLIKYIDKTDHASHEFFWFGEKNSLEERTYSELRKKISGLYFVAITSGKRRREKELVALVKNIGGLFGLGWGVIMSLYYISSKKIDVIFCKGGFVSLPVVIAGWILRKRIVLHESDTTPGLSNRICSKFADVIFTGFVWVFPEKEIVVGQIIDDDLVSAYESKTHGNKTTNILVTWWSQWSKSIYDAVKKIVEKEVWDNRHFHIILWSQNQDLHSWFTGYKNVTVYPFVAQHEMGKLLALCDLAITRGGTTSLAEEQLFRIKKIIIPIPWTHDQMKNAQYYVKHYGDILVDQTTATYQENLEKIIGEYSNYKKEKYDDPRDIVTASKEKISNELLK